eukprot:2245889-Amphidinium_carterae.1
MKEVLREQAKKAEEDDKQRTTRVQEETAASSSATSATAAQGENQITEERKKTPPRPTREAPIPANQRVPPTSGALSEVQGLSPRLQLKTENFKNTPGKTDDSYYDYERKLFDEIRQKSYIIQHPTNQYHNLTPEIKRIYD